MLYLLDANILISAEATYYPITQFPEFWDWILHQANLGQVKMPSETLVEVLEGRKDNDPLLDWLDDETCRIMRLDEKVNVALVQRIVAIGYANDLTDEEVEGLGRDPFLIAYALADGSNRCVVTTEVPRPSKKRQNRRVPDVCASRASRGALYLN